MKIVFKVYISVSIPFIMEKKIFLFSKCYVKRKVENFSFSLQYNFNLEVPLLWKTI